MSDGVERDAGGAQGDVGGEQDRVDPGEHGDRRRLDTRFGEPAGDHVDDRLGAAVGFVFDDAQRPGVASLCSAGDDLLGDAPLVVAEQRRRRRDDLGGAPVVDAQGVLAGAGEQRADSR